MSGLEDGKRCPCNSGATYGECCGPLHRSERAAATAEQLMRSRYAAFALGLVDYLIETWHPDTCPSDVHANHPERWTGLTILGTTAGGLLDADGQVEFIAHNTSGDLQQRSTFVRRGGRWVFVD